jgi:hypothetical protein
MGHCFVEPNEESLTDGRNVKRQVVLSGILLVRAADGLNLFHSFRHGFQSTKYPGFRKRDEEALKKGRQQMKPSCSLGV